MSELGNFLKKNNRKARAMWGLMDYQNMIEHLSLILEVSTSQRPAELKVTPEQAVKLKRIMIESDRPMPEGIKSELLPKNEALPHIMEGISESIDFFEQNLDLFLNMARKEPNKQTMHPTMGLLKMAEWKVLHFKHFVHHFKQFNLQATSEIAQTFK